MRTTTRADQISMSPEKALELLREGNIRFVRNLKANRNLLQQVNETRENQHPFAVVISCMDSRTSAELIFDQGLGDIFSVRVAGNVINEDILGSAEFGCKIIGAKVLLVLGHTNCSAISGAIENIELGHMHHITAKIQRVIPQVKKTFKCATNSDLVSRVTHLNVDQGILDIRTKSNILARMELEGQIKIFGGIYNLSTGLVEFFEKEY